MFLFSCRNQIESDGFAVVVLIYRTGQFVENLKKGKNKNFHKMLLLFAKKLLSIILGISHVYDPAARILFLKDQIIMLESDIKKFK